MFRHHNSWNFQPRKRKKNESLVKNVGCYFWARNSILNDSKEIIFRQIQAKIGKKIQIAPKVWQKQRRDLPWNLPQEAERAAPSAGQLEHRLSLSEPATQKDKGKHAGLQTPRARRGQGTERRQDAGTDCWNDSALSLSFLCAVALETL